MTTSTHPENAFSFPLSNLRLGEFDIGGVLYHASYFHIFEMAREALYKHLELPYADMVNSGAHLAVTESHMNFLAPIAYGVELEVYLWVESLKRASLEFHYEIFNSELAPVGVLHQAWTKHAFVQEEGGTFTVTALPEELIQAFRQFSIGD